MTDNFHHGPEINERREAAGIVREVKSAVTFITGTAPVHLIAQTPEARAKLINTRLIIRRREDIARLLGPNLPGYTLPQAIEAIFNKVMDGKGGGTIIAVNVFDPDRHKDGDSKPDPSTVTASDIIGSYDAAGNASGFKLAYGCYNAYGFFPKILLAPGFTELASVRAEMAVIASTLKAMSIVDLPLGITVQQALEQRGTDGMYNTASERTILCYPRVLALDSAAGDLTLQPYSQHYAGVLIATDLSQGYHYSPSNREMVDVFGLERDISWYPDDTRSDTDLLNGAGLVTVMNGFGEGYRTWGNRSAAFPTAIDMKNFIHARRIFDMVHEAILYYSVKRIDVLGDPAMMEMVEEDVNAFLRRKEGDRALYGGRFRFNREQTTARTVADGQYFYTLAMMPMGLVERLTVDSYLDLSFAKTALGLSS